jgi:hypothetical protein
MAIWFTGIYSTVWHTTSFDTRCRRLNDNYGDRMPKCSICSNPDAPYTATRASGMEGRPEQWHFCRECWQIMQEQRADTDPYVCQRYVIFLKYLAGKYERRMAGNHPLTVGVISVLPSGRISEVCGVSPDFTSRIHRDQVSFNDTCPKSDTSFQPITRTGRDGKQYPASVPKQTEKEPAKAGLRQKFPVVTLLHLNRTPLGMKSDIRHQYQSKPKKNQGRDISGKKELTGIIT